MLGMYQFLSREYVSFGVEVVSEREKHEGNTHEEFQHGRKKGASDAQTMSVVLGSYEAPVVLVRKLLYISKTPIFFSAWSNRIGTKGTLRVVIVNSVPSVSWDSLGPVPITPHS